MSRTVRARVSDDLAARVDAVMAAEDRNESEIVRRALERYCPEGVPQRAGASGAEADGPVGIEPPARVLPRRKLSRTSPCEHRVPPTSYCKECDG